MYIFIYTNECNYMHGRCLSKNAVVLLSSPGNCDAAQDVHSLAVTGAVQDVHCLGVLRGCLRRRHHSLDIPEHVHGRLGPDSFDLRGWAGFLEHDSFLEACILDHASSSHGTCGVSHGTCGGPRSHGSCSVRHSSVQRQRAAIPRRGLREGHLQLRFGLGHTPRHKVLEHSWSMLHADDP